MSNCRIWNKAIAILVSISMIPLGGVANPSIGYAMPVSPAVMSADYFQSSPVNARAPLLKIPEKLGTLDESFQGSTNKTIVYIQDAHDSIEAQENIAKLIHHLVEQYGVRSVYEEGFAGRVPTDEYFKVLTEDSLKEKVSYFLLDELRISGAEYAHINRPKEFSLIGADDVKMYLENIMWYQKAAAVRVRADRNLEILRRAVWNLAQTRFPPAMKSWMKLQERFHDGKLGLADYLQRASRIYLAASSEQKFMTAFPNLHWLLQGLNENKKSRSSLDSKALFLEIEALEKIIAQTFLTQSVDRSIYECGKALVLLKKLNKIEMTTAEYQAVKPVFSQIKTQDVARLVFNETGKSVVFPKQWERDIRYAMRFYEAASARDAAVEKQLDRFLARPGDDTAILVFGGFHKSGIKEILTRKNISYYILTPKISAPDDAHRRLYQKRMAQGWSALRIPELVKKAARPVGDFLKASFASEQAEALRAQIQTVAGIVRQLEKRPEFSQAPRGFLDQAVARTLEGEVRRASEISEGLKNSVKFLPLEQRVYEQFYSYRSETRQPDEPDGKIDSANDQTPTAQPADDTEAEVLAGEESRGRIQSVAVLAKLAERYKLPLPDGISIEPEMDDARLAVLSDDLLKRLLKEFREQIALIKRTHEKMGGKISRKTYEHLKSNLNEYVKTLRDVTVDIAVAYQIAEGFFGGGESQEANQRLFDLSMEAIIWRSSYQDWIDDIFAMTSSAALVKPGGFLAKDDWIRNRLLAIFRTLGELEMHDHRKFAAEILLHDRHLSDEHRAIIGLVYGHYLRVRYYPLNPTMLAEAIKMLEISLAALERTDAEVITNVWGETRERMKKRLTFVVISLLLRQGSEASTRKALDLTYSVMDLPDGSFHDGAWLDDARIIEKRIIAKMYLGYLMKSDHVAESKQYFDEALEDSRRFIDHWQDIEEDEKNAWRRYYQGLRAYLSGELEQARLIYGGLMGTAPHGLKMVVPYDYTSVLHQLGDTAGARKAVVEFFKQMNLSRKTEEAAVFEDYRSEVFQLPGVENSLERVIDLAIEILRDPAEWPDDLDILYETTKFALQFRVPQRSEARSVIESAVNKFYAQGILPSTRWEQIQTILNACFEERPYSARKAVVRMIAASRERDPEFSKKLDEYLMKDARRVVENQNSFFQYFAETVGGIPNEEQMEALRVKFNDLMSATIIVNEYKLESVFETLKEFNQKLDIHRADTLQFGVIYYYYAISLVGDFYFTFSDFEGDYYKNLNDRFARSVPIVFREFKEAVRKHRYADNSTHLMAGYSAMIELANTAHNRDIWEQTMENMIKIYTDLWVDKETKKIRTLKTGEKSILQTSSFYVLVAISKYMDYMCLKGRTKVADELLPIWVQFFDVFVEALEAEVGQTPESDKFIADLMVAFGEAFSNFNGDLLFRLVTDKNQVSGFKRLAKFVLRYGPQNLTRNKLLLIGSLVEMIHEEAVALQIDKALFETRVPENESLIGLIRESELMNLYAERLKASGKVTEAEAVYVRVRQLLEAAEAKLTDKDRGESNEMFLKMGQSLYEMSQGNSQQAIDILVGAKPTERGLGPVFGIVMEIHLALIYQLAGRPAEAQRKLVQTFTENVNAIRKDQKKKDAQTSTHDIPDLLAWMILRLSADSQKVLSGLFMEVLMNPDFTQLHAWDRELMMRYAADLNRENTEVRLLKYFKEIIEGRQAFDAKRDEVLIRWLAAYSGQAFEILENLIAVIQKSGKSVPKYLTELRKQLVDNAKPEDFIPRIEAALAEGKYDTAFKIANNALRLVSASTSSLVRDRLAELKRRSEKAIQLFAETEKYLLDTDYDEARYQGYMEMAKQLLQINSNDQRAADILRICPKLKGARQFVLQGQWDDAMEILRRIDATDRDRRLNTAIASINVFSQNLAEVGQLLDRKEYLQAEAKLQAALDQIQKDWGASPTLKNQPVIADLFTSIEYAKLEVEGFRERIRNAQTRREVYENAKKLVLFPSHRQEPFTLILERAFRIFNEAAGESKKSARESKYVQAFNMARLVYELHEFCRQNDFNFSEPANLLRADLVISHSAANIWLPQLVDEFFQVTAMVEAEEKRDERERKLLGPAKGDTAGAKSARVEFDFNRFTFLRRSGDLKISGFKQDMTGFVLRGDTFAIKAADGKEVLHYIFHVKDHGADYITLELSDTDENLEIIKKDLMEALGTEAGFEGGKKLGSLIRTRNTSWVRQRDVSEEFIVKLQETTQTQLDFDNITMANATTGNPVLNELLGVRIKHPANMTEAELWKILEDRNEALVEQKELNDGEKLDEAQRAGVISALSPQHSYAFFWGPPGTGKTKTIVTLTELLLASRQSIYIESHQHKAVDVIGMRLKGRLEKSNIGKAESEQLVMARVGNMRERIEPKLLDLWDHRAELLDRLAKKKIRDEGTLILATIPGMSLDQELHLRPTLRDTKVVIVDEATQATPLAVVLAVCWPKGVRFVALSGDPKQLPAYGIGDDDIELAKSELKAPIRHPKLGERTIAEIFEPSRVESTRISLFERAVEIFSSADQEIFEVTRQPLFFLDHQRRSVRPIVELSNYDYEGQQLTAARRDPEGNVPEGIFVLDDTDYNAPEIKSREYNVIMNPGEVDRVVHWVNWLLNREELEEELPPAEEPFAGKSISMRSPYNDQVDQMRFAIVDFASLHAYLRGIETGNLHPSIQGQDIMEMLKNDVSEEEIRGIVESSRRRRKSTEPVKKETLNLHINYIKRRLAKISEEKIAEEYADMRLPFEARQQKIKNDYELLKTLIQDLIREPTPEKARAIRELLRLGERFITLEEIDEFANKLFSTVDSSIGSQYRFGILSMVRSNQDGPNGTGITGFMAQVIENREVGRRRRLVATSRDEDGMIMIWSAPTYEHATDAEMREWADHVENVYLEHMDRKQKLDQERHARKAAAPEVKRSEVRGAEEAKAALVSTRLPAGQNVDEMLAPLTIPAVVYVHYDDLVRHFSDSQRAEIYALALQYPEKLRLVIYNADLTGDILKPFRQLEQRKRNVRITAAHGAEAFENAQRTFTRGLKKFSNIHLSKSKKTVGDDWDSQTSRDITFFRYQSHQKEMGLLAAALLWKEYVELGRRIEGIMTDEEGYLTIADRTLRDLVQRYESSLAILMAA